MPDEAVDTSTGTADAPPAAAPAAAPAPAAPPPQPDTTAEPMTSQYEGTAQPMTPAPASTEGVRQPDPENWGAKVYHGVLAALGGSNQVQISRGDDGKLVASAPKPSTPGQQWKRIIAGAMSGVAAASGGSMIGPGAAGRSFSAGVGGGIERAQQTQKKQIDLANQDYDEQQKAIIQKAQLAMLTQETTAAAFRLTREGVDAQFVDASRANDFTKYLIDNGAQDLGVSAGVREMLELHHNDPAILQAQTDGRLLSTPQRDPDTGKLAGVHFAIVQPDFMKQRNTKPVQLGHMAAPKAPGEMPTPEYDTIPAGGIQNGAYMVANQDFQNTLMQAEDRVYKLKTDAAKEKREDALAQASIGKDWAETRKANAETRQTEAQGGDDIESQAQALAHGDQAVSQMQKRGKTYNQILHRANEITQQETGKPFDVEANELRYRQKQDVIKDFSVGDASKTIVSFDKFLGHALSASQAVNDLRNTNVPWVNTPMNKLKVGAGTKDSPAVIAALIEAENVRTEWQSMLNNNHALTVEDKKVGDKAFSTDGTLAQMQQGLKTLAGTAATRLRATDFGYRRVMHESTPDLISPEGARALQHFGIDPRSVYSSPSPTRAPLAPAPPPAGFVSVQIPGQPPGQIPQSALADFKQKHPNAIVNQTVSR